TIVINGIVTDENGQQVYQFDRRLPLNLRSEQVDSIRDRLMSFQDVFPLVPGKYKLSILLKNYVSKEFTSFEASISIPDRGLLMSPLVLANRLTRSNQYRGLNKAFLLDDLQFVPSPRNDFVVGDRLYAVFQLWGLTPELKQSGSLNYEIVKENGDKVKSFSKKISDYQGSPVFYEEIYLEGWSPANYMLTVTLTDNNNNVVISQKENFFISHLPALSRSWVMTQPVEGDNSAEVQHALGLQYWNRQDQARAVKYLEAAYRLNPKEPAYALDYCRLLLASRKYQEVIAVAGPFVSQEQNYDFLEILGQAAQALSQYEQAINYYKQYLAHFGTNINILNAIGECYSELGNADEALYAWERSLQLEPNQEKIRAQIKTLKEKKKN
ncbi:MAG: tetratricopeptide repeat protein, partial [Candidatus Aminicenantales bacterium]